MLELQYLQLKVEFALKSVAVARLLTARRAKTFPKAPVDSKISKREHEAGDGLQKNAQRVAHATLWKVMILNVKHSDK